MKETFWFKFTAVVALTLHVFGASAFLLTVLALCGVHMNWWIGALSVVPGWLIVMALAALAEHEQRKMRDAFIEKHVKVLEKVLRKVETEGEPKECVHFTGERVQSCEDPDTVYIELDGIRIILHEGKTVGWYRCE